MLKIKEESIKKLVEINNILNEINIKGAQNISIMYHVILGIQQILQETDEINREIDEKIIIDNTKGGK